MVLLKQKTETLDEYRRIMSKTVFLTISEAAEQVNKDHDDGVYKILRYHDRIIAVLDCINDAVYIDDYPVECETLVCAFLDHYSPDFVFTVYH